MMVYGDAARRVSFRTLLHEAARQHERALLACGSERAERCRELLICLGCLAQALLDHEFARVGSDELGAPAQVCAELLRAGARGLMAAYGSDQAGDGWAARVERALASARGLLALEQTLEEREPEGYAHYGVYPEMYLRAAEACARPTCADWCVIGVRSIGTSLGAVVSEALEARCFATLRPTGHPYARRVQVGTGLAAELLASSRAHYAIVDEGPGRSGSSFAAVFAWLLAHGVAAARIHFFPSHTAPPGPHGDPRFLAAYAATARHHVSFERAMLRGDEDAPWRWFHEELGDCHRDVRDLSGGRWRALRYADPACYPPSHVCGEARKLLVTNARGQWLVKQLGLGARARACLRTKRRLGELGLAPRLTGARDGYFVQVWHGEAGTLTHAQHEREALLDALERYLVFLSRGATATQWPGARPPVLFEQLCTHVRALLGGSRFSDAPILAQLQAALPRLDAEWSPVITDNHLDAHEWLVLPSGSILKADAVEHSRAHDLIGRQDPAWDVAGATVELQLDALEQERLVRALRDRAQRSLCPSTIAFYELAYLAFRAAQADLQQTALREHWAEDAERMANARDRYLARLSARLC